eukprot:scaffold105527_cov24-Prasinocladus_malaysianus.AAC.1
MIPFFHLFIQSSSKRLQDNSSQRSKQTSELALLGGWHSIAPRVPAGTPGGPAHAGPRVRLSRALRHLSSAERACVAQTLLRASQTCIQARAIACISIMINQPG